jgi:glucokinase
MDTRTILLDVGGTFVKCSDRRSIPINSAGTREEITSSLRQALGDADKAAIAIPGPFDYSSGTFLMKHKFAAVYGERFADLTGFRGELRFIHDVNAMLLGEVTAGAGLGCSRVALVTLGTGLGFSMSIDGEILKNDMGSPRVSIFNIPYRDGILEDYASKRGISRGFEGVTVKELADKARSGAADALARFQEMGEIVAESIASILEEYGIECLLFGGQISRSFDLFGPAVKEGLYEVSSLRYVGPVSDIDRATFNGLETLL